MTSDQVGGLMLIALALIFLSGRKKRQSPPARSGMVFVEVVEMIEIPKKPKVPGFVVNMAILVGIFGFIWIMNH